MLAKNLVREIIKRGGTAEITEREGNRSDCKNCHKFIVRHNVLVGYEGGEDYTAWFLDPDYDKFIEGETNGQRCEVTGQAHDPHRDYELSGVLGSYDVHMYLSNSGDPKTGGSSYFTVRAISKRGTYDMGSDYNPGQWTFCSRLKDLDWACR